MNEEQRAVDDATALLKRGQELISRHDPRLEDIWDNHQFHIATVLLESNAGITIPKGHHAQAYIALVVAALEHRDAAIMLSEALAGDTE
jgi:hypothetical protein